MTNETKWQKTIGPRKAGWQRLGQVNDKSSTLVVDREPAPGGWTVRVRLYSDQESASSQVLVFLPDPTVQT